MEKKIQKAYKEQRSQILTNILNAIENKKLTTDIYRNNNCDHYDIMFILSGLKSNQLINVTQNEKETNKYILRWTNPNSIINYLNRPIINNKQNLFI
jgi:hypothetical protein